APDPIIVCLLAAGNSRGVRLPLPGGPGVTAVIHDREMDLTRDQVIAHRIAAQQLDRAPSSGRPVTDAAILDLGVQDSGRDGASWALANRGVPVASPSALAAADDLSLVWSLRVSP